MIPPTMSCFPSVIRNGCLLIHPYSFHWSLLFLAAHSDGLRGQFVPSNWLDLVDTQEEKGILGLSTSTPLSTCIKER